MKVILFGINFVRSLLAPIFGVFGKRQTCVAMGHVPDSGQLTELLLHLQLTPWASNGQALDSGMIKPAESFGFAMCRTLHKLDWGLVHFITFKIQGNCIWQGWHVLCRSVRAGREQQAAQLLHMEGRNPRGLAQRVTQCSEKHLPFESNL